MNLRQIFGKRVRRGRMALGMNQQEFARLVEIPYPTLSRIEHGEQSLYYERVLAIAEALNVSTDFLLNRTDDPTPPRRARSKRQDAIEVEPERQEVAV
jgi:transcriptional regulator with XRE-family HTH domain